MKSIKTKKCKNGVNETTKDNERWGRTTREREHHVPVKIWARKRDKKQERMREKEKGNVSERELWSSSAYKSENEEGRQSVKVKTVKLEAPRRFWASNRCGVWPEISNFNYNGPPCRLETHNWRGANPNFTHLFPQFSQRDHDVGWSPITDVMVGHTTSVCSS